MLLVLLAACIGGPFGAGLSFQTREVPIEKSEPLKGGGGLGTAGYGARPTEEPFLKKVTEKPVGLWADLKMPKAANLSDEEWAKMQKEMDKERAGQIPVEKYQLADQGGQYVGWFGILREASRDEKTGGSSLLIQHQYFDGMVDLHQQIVSCYGAGDFRATLPQKSTLIPPLSLVVVYGKVAKDKAGGATVAAEYVRYWDWGLFAFMNYGKDKSNPRWVKLRQADGDKAYSSTPTSAYYEERLGKRN